MGPNWDRVAMYSGAGVGARPRDSNRGPAYCLSRLPFTHTHTLYDVITLCIDYLDLLKCFSSVSSSRRWQKLCSGILRAGLQVFRPHREDVGGAKLWPGNQAFCNFSFVLAQNFAEFRDFSRTEFCISQKGHTSRLLWSWHVHVHLRSLFNWHFQDALQASVVLTSPGAEQASVV